MKCWDRLKFCLIFTVFYLAILIILPLATDLEHYHEDPETSVDTKNSEAQSSKPDFEGRRKRLDQMCQKYSDPSKPEFGQITNTQLAKINHFNYRYLNHYKTSHIHV